MKPKPKDRRRKYDSASKFERKKRGKNPKKSIRFGY